MKQKSHKSNKFHSISPEMIEPISDNIKLNWFQSFFFRWNNSINLVNPIIWQLNSNSIKLMNVWLICHLMRTFINHIQLRDRIKNQSIQLDYHSVSSLSPEMIRSDEYLRWCQDQTPTMITSCSSLRVEFIPVFSHPNVWLMRWLHSLISMLNLIFLLLPDGFRFLFPLWFQWCYYWTWSHKSLSSQHFLTLWWVRLSCVLWMRNDLFLRPVWLSSSSSFSLMIFGFSPHVMSMVWLSELKTIEWRQWPITTKWLLLHFCRSASDDSSVTFSHNSQFLSVSLFHKILTFISILLFSLILIFNF